MKRTLLIFLFAFGMAAPSVSNAVAEGTLSGCPDTWVTSTTDLFASGNYQPLPRVGGGGPKELVDKALLLGFNISIKPQPSEISFDGTNYKKLSQVQNSLRREMKIILSGAKERFGYLVAVSGCPKESIIYYYHSIASTGVTQPVDLHTWFLDPNNRKSHRMDILDFKQVANFEASFNSCVTSIKSNAAKLGNNNYSEGLWQFENVDEYQSTPCRVIQGWDMTLVPHNIDCLEPVDSYFRIQIERTCVFSLGWPDNGECDGCSNKTPLFFATFTVTGPTTSPEPVPTQVKEIKKISGPNPVCPGDYEILGKKIPSETGYLITCVKKIDNQVVKTAVSESDAANKQADKIIADAKAQADKIIADAKAQVSSKKKLTIICEKIGKLSKILTAINPKCPNGYKKKK